MILGTALIVLCWTLFLPILNMWLWLAIVLTVVGAFMILFGLLFTVYFFNLDMKLMALLQPILIKMHDKRKKKQRTI